MELKKGDLEKPPEELKAAEPVNDSDGLKKDDLENNPDGLKSDDPLNKPEELNAEDFENNPDGLKDLVYISDGEKADDFENASVVLETQEPDSIWKPSEHSTQNE